MFDHAKLEWQQFRHSPCGRRFSLFYEKHHRHGGGVKLLLLFAAFVSFIIGVILAFIPGPAILFFAITLALVATQSRWLASRLDESELWLRLRYRVYRLKRWRRGLPSGKRHHAT